jgi:hypothetical protein
MSLISVDVEADGPYPGDYSMVSFGMVVVSDMSKTFHGKVKPISEFWLANALAVSNITREEHLKYDNPVKVMIEAEKWLTINSVGAPVFISDNPAFDFAWMNYYFHKYTGHNPFGFSARRIGDIYCGLMKDLEVNKEWKRKYRKTKHSHDAIDDATGNAEAIIAFRDKLGLFGRI